jgi:hypothetical protein
MPTLPAVRFPKIRNRITKFPHSLRRVVHRAVIDNQDLAIVSRELLHEHAIDGLFHVATVVVRVN